MADLTVTFTFREDDVWIDPEGTAWYYKGTAADGRALFKRFSVTYVDHREAARTWRRMGNSA